jgi:hypothetical protein
VKEWYTSAAGNGLGYKVFDRKGKLVSKEDEDKDDPHGDSHARNFVECLKSRWVPNAEIEIGHTYHSVPPGQHRGSHRSKFEVRRKTETIVNDPEANKLLRRSYRKHWATPKDV